VAKFTVVEAINTKLSNLKVEGLTIPINPMTPDKLYEWLKTVAKIHEKTQKASQTWVEALKREHQNVVEKIRRAEEELTAAKRQLDTTKAYSSAASKIHSDEDRKKSEQVKQLQAQHSQLLVLIETKEKGFAEANTKCNLKSEELKVLVDQ
jgi:hypothetical protein